jgi:DNA-directed RNA polymerase subunit RPC12/RpoP
MSWHGLNNLGSKQYKCSFCGNIVATGKGFFSKDNQRIFICPHCNCPTYFDKNNNQMPDVAPGNEVQHLPEELNALYRESRNCVTVSSYTGAVLLCRKLLMNIAVGQGAKEGKSFISYVDYLAEQGFIPPNGRGWVDHIRKKGNEATHEIALMQREDADELISFAEMLMKFIYEFPNKIPNKSDT